MTAAAAAAAIDSPLADAERRLDDGDTAEAVRILTSVVAQQPYSAEANILLARAAIATRQPQQALVLLRAARDRASGRQKLHIRLQHGWIFFGRMLDQKAHAEFSAVYERRHSGIDAKAVGDALYGMARLLLRQGRKEAAFAKLEEALQFAPRHRRLLASYADALADLNQRERALAAVQLGIANGCVDPEVLNRAGNVLRKLGLAGEATRLYEIALRLMPGETAIANNLGVALYDQGRREEAARIFTESLRRDPNNAVIRHLHAAVTGADAPARASDSFIEVTFDTFAASFDEKLVGELGYRAPQIIGEALQPLLSATTVLDVLDLGCGTGLCGPILRLYARRLVGIDLSERMLAKARERGLYDELLKTEITHYLVREPGAWDLIVAADVLVYFGALEAVLAAAQSALRPGGRFSFTVERDDQAAKGWGLNANGRYAHSGTYLGALAPAFGFAVEVLASTVPRYEHGTPVDGYVVVLKRS
jgi:predicted TPR repeat methyltransferase